jgi:flavin reductase (DIM6/NTAB) family NADH-FMN oxidoreductase RutF
LFVGLDVEDGPCGPIIATLGTRAHCRLERSVETGFHRLVTGLIEQIDVEARSEPLLYYRGRYRRLGDVPETGSGSKPGSTS